MTILETFSKFVYEERGLFMPKSLGNAVGIEPSLDHISSMLKLE